MEIVRTIESKLGDVAKGLPHLPAEFRKWLAENAWWLVIIGVVLSVFGILALLPLLTLASVATTVVDSYYPYTQAAAPSLVSVWVSLGFLVAIVAIEAMAISPLKAMKKRGWDLLFLAMLVSVVSALVNIALTFGPFSLVSLLWAAIGTAIGLYVLFEVRSHFTPGYKAAAKKS